jgi:hypothetical protein
MATARTVRDLRDVRYLMEIVVAKSQPQFPSIESSGDVSMFSSIFPDTHRIKRDGETGIFR